MNSRVSNTPMARASLTLAMAGSVMMAVAAAASESPAAPTGPYGVVREYDPSVSPAQTVYRPRDLGKAGRVPVLLWGNGGCAANGGSTASPFLMQIASEGYLIITPGKPGQDATIEPTSNRVERPAPAPAPAPRAPAGEDPPRPPAGGIGADASTYKDVLGGLEWAIAENSRPTSIYYNKVDTAKVAVAGHSCGGLQAILAGADPRIDTALVLNSGVVVPAEGERRDRSASGTMGTGKAALAGLHTPVLYINGGPNAIEYKNSLDDFARISHVPIFMGEVQVNHGGTFRQQNGGSYAKVIKAWLDWQVKGDQSAASWFTGANCTLCTDPDWKVSRKSIK